MNRVKSKLVREVMNPGVVTIRDDRSVSDLAAFLMENEISGAPVVDAKGKLVGVVSVTDIVEQRTVDDDASPREREPHWDEMTSARQLQRMRRKGDGVLVRDIMTPTVYTIPDDTLVSEAARTMIAGRIHRLFVTNGGHIVGIVTTLDLLKLLAEEEPVSARASSARP